MSFGSDIATPRLLSSVTIKTLVSWMAKIWTACRHTKLQVVYCRGTGSISGTMLLIAPGAKNLKGVAVSLEVTFQT